jgi:cytochrome c biogenesis protein CcmG/thiol:disulfide interchange protein DsbE
MTRVRLFVPLMLFLLICGVSYVGFSLNDRHQLPSALLDKPFPEFSAASLLEQDRRISKADFLGSPTLVNVWATWCPTCKSEHDELLRIAAGSDIQMVGVNYKDDIGLAQELVGAIR